MSGEAAMECRRAEELLSDHLEGALEEPLLSELETHLASCAACRELQETLAEVVAALREHPALEAPLGLAERAAAAALARPSAPGLRRTGILTWRFRNVPALVQATAAALALVVTGLVLLAIGPEGGWRGVRRLKERTLNAGAYVMERKDRLVEDFRILRVVVGTAFGSRVGSVSDRVEDYRRLLGRKRGGESEPKKTKGTDLDGAGLRLARGPHFSEPQRARTRTL